MKAILTLNHPDSVSGMTIMDDGTKAYWTEGRSSYVDIVYPDGKQESVSNASKYGDHKIMAVLSGDDMGLLREMTLAETIEHDVHRNRNLGHNELLEDVRCAIDLHTNR